MREAKKNLKKVLRKDYYKILDISQNATDYEIKKAYRTQAKLWHPDKHNETPESYDEAEKRFKDITEANTILSDPKKRASYDRGDDLEEEPTMSSQFSPEMFQAFFSNGGGGGGFNGFGGMPQFHTRFQ